MSTLLHRLSSPRVGGWRSKAELVVIPHESVVGGVGLLFILVSPTTASALAVFLFVINLRLSKGG